MNASPIWTNITAGELSPLVMGRVDLAKYNNCARTLVNWLIHTQGPTSFRPGLRFINEVKDSTKRGRLLPFEFSTSQAYMLEFGDNYLRIYYQKGILLAGEGLPPLELVTPYAADQIADIRIEKSADVMYLFHPLYMTRKLARHSHTNWTLNTLQPTDGPYLPQNTTDDTLAPSAVSGTVTLTAVTVPLELVKNGSFDAPAQTSLQVDWSVGRMDPVTIIDPEPWGDPANWNFDYDNNIVNHIVGDDSPLEQPLQTVEGKTYTLVFTIANCTAGSVTPMVGDANGTVRSANGTYTEDIVALSLNGAFKFNPTTTFNGSIKAVSVKMKASSAEFFQPGHVGAYFRILHGSTWGYAKVTKYLTPLTVKADVKTTFGGTAAVSTWREGAFSGVRGYPWCGVLHEQRLWLCATNDRPCSLWSSKSSDYENFTPGVDDADPCSYALPETNPIVWVRSANVLLVGTEGNEYRIMSDSPNVNPLTPTNVSARRCGSYGSYRVEARVVGDAVIYVQRHGRKVREQTYDWAKDTFVAVDISILSEHITHPMLTELAHQRTPDQVLWGIRSDGALVGCTYERLQEVVGWHRHTTDGLFESVACIPGETQDEVWVIVNRTISGVTKRYVEVMENLDFGPDQRDCFFVDSGLSYSGAPLSTFAGLDHLEGKTVAILADGAVIPNQVVVGGSVHLSVAASKVHVGLPYRGILIPVRPEAGAQDGTAQGKVKRIHGVTVRLDRSQGIKVGPTVDLLDVVMFRGGHDLMGAPPALFSGDLAIPFDGSYETDGNIAIVQDFPLPCTVVAIMPRLNTSDGWVS